MRKSPLHLIPITEEDIVYQFLINYKITAIIFSLFILYISVISIIIYYIIIFQEGKQNNALSFSEKVNSCSK